MQQAAQPFPATDFADRTADFPACFDETILQSLVIAFSVIMKDVFTHRASQHGLTKENHAIGAFLPKTAPETLQMCVQIGRLRRQAHRRGARVAQHLAKSGTELAVPIHQDIALRSQKAIPSRRQIPGHLLHPDFVRIRCDTGAMDPARGQLHDEEQVICHQSLAGPDLDRREVDSGQNLPVGLEKRCPRGLILPLGRRLDAVALQDVGYGPIRDDMPQIGQRPLNAIMAYGEKTRPTLINTAVLVALCPRMPGSAP